MRSVEEVQTMFKYDHLPANLQAVSMPFHDLAVKVYEDGPDGPMVTKALNDLWQAKNWAVANIAQNGAK